jgi:proteic killer suppression protein
MRIALLEEADCLADLRDAPGNWHPLTADRAGQWSASVNGNHRLIFRPDQVPLPCLSDGGLDAAQVTKVEIIEVADYHGR